MKSSSQRLYYLLYSPDLKYTKCLIYVQSACVCRYTDGRSPLLKDNVSNSKASLLVIRVLLLINDGCVEVPEVYVNSPFLKAIEASYTLEENVAAKVKGSKTNQANK